MLKMNWSRFGPTAAMHIVKPILEKLWDADIKLLAKGSLHCFFDRLVMAEKFQADELKSSPSLDRVIANPAKKIQKVRFMVEEWAFYSKKDVKIFLNHSINGQYLQALI